MKQEDLKNKETNDEVSEKEQKSVAADNINNDKNLINTAHTEEKEETEEESVEEVNVVAAPKDPSILDIKAKEGVKNRDLHLLNDLHAALQHETHHKLTWTIFLLFAFLACFVTWSYFSEIEEVTRGQGSIIPSSREQVIQSLDPGIVEDMLVKEGEVVEKGQVLLKLDDTRSSAILREIESKVDSLEAMEARLIAETTGNKLVFPDTLSEKMIKRETAIYNARKSQLEQSLETLTASQNLLDKEIKITTPMVKKGAVSEVELLRLHRQASEAALQIDERRNKFITEANSELGRIQGELAQARENMAMRADPVERALIRSPLKGIVKNIRINTIGGVISAGQDILEIVPLDEKLIVEAYISPRDVAYVKPGMEALIKLTAYDYAIYGGLKGKVTLISPDALRDKKRSGDLALNPNEAYYRVLVATDENSLTDKNGEILPIIPGMIASIDIKTGQKTVFQYLIKPITRFKQALSER